MRINEIKAKAITEAEFDKLAEKQDACYHKVKSRYKVWSSSLCPWCLSEMQKSWCKKLG